MSREIISMVDFIPSKVILQSAILLLFVIVMTWACARVPHSPFVNHLMQCAEEPCVVNQGCNQPGMLCGFPQLGREKQSAVLESIKADLNLPEDQLLMIGK